MDSSTKGSETGMLVSTATICFNSGCTRHAYDLNMLARHAKRIPDTEISKGYPTTTVHRQHYVFRGRFGGGSKEPIYTTDHFADFSALQINHVKLAFVGFELIRREFAICNAQKP